MTRRVLIAGASALAVLVGAGTAEASCILQTAAQQRGRADVIFNGVALDNPSPSGVQRFRVSRYLKARGPAVVRVQTGNRVYDNGSGSMTSVSIVAKKGQRWRILAEGNPWKELQTNVCAGSRRLG